MPLTSVLDELNVDPDDVITDENLQAEADETASDDLGVTDPDLEFPGEGELIVTKDENTGDFNAVQDALDDVESNETIFVYEGDYTDEGELVTPDTDETGVEDVTLFTQANVVGVNFASVTIQTDGFSLIGSFPEDAPNVDRDGNPLP